MQKFVPSNKITISDYSFSVFFQADLVWNVQYLLPGKIKANKLEVCTVNRRLFRFIQN